MAGGGLEMAQLNGARLNETSQPGLNVKAWYCTLLAQGNKGISQNSELKVVHTTNSKNDGNTHIKSVLAKGGVNTREM